jgi:hypothetical protein
MLVALGIVEFAFAFNAVLATNFASRAAALTAAEAGNLAGSDCVILRDLEAEVGGPADPARIQRVDIFWTDANGAQKGGNVNAYDRVGSTTCAVAGAAPITVPYTRIQDDYPVDNRCNIIAGCPDTPDDDPHPGLDMIGVRVTYSHHWVTLLHSFLPGGDGGYLFQRSNVMRMEPVL